MVSSPTTAYERALADHRHHVTVVEAMGFALFYTHYGVGYPGYHRAIYRLQCGSEMVSGPFSNGVWRRSTHWTEMPEDLRDDILAALDRLTGHDVRPAIEAALDRARSDVSVALARLGSTIDPEVRALLDSAMVGIGHARRANDRTTAERAEASLVDARAHLQVALMQVTPSDDEIIVEHMREALRLLDGLEAAP